MGGLTEIMNIKKELFFKRKDEFNFGCAQLAFLKSIHVKQGLG